MLRQADRNGQKRLEHRNKLDSTLATTSLRIGEEEDKAERQKEERKTTTVDCVDAVACADWFGRSAFCKQSFTPHERVDANKGKEKAPPCDCEVRGR